MIIILCHFGQLINFVRFCELVVAKCRNLKFISVTTVKDPNGARVADQISAFNALTTDLKNRNITLSIDYSEQLHDRQIMYKFFSTIKFRSDEFKFCDFFSRLV